MDAASDYADSQAKTEDAPYSAGVEDASQDDDALGQALAEDYKKEERSNACTVFFSHFLLTSMVILYSVIGGFLFEYLEGEHEQFGRNNVAKWRNYTAQRLYHFSYQAAYMEQINWTSAAEEILQEYQYHVLEATRHYGFDGREEEDKIRSWSFTGSLLYSITIITTIGYGNTTPKTTPGRLITMLYAVIGVPLTLLCLSTLGETFAFLFTTGYEKLAINVFKCRPRPHGKHRVNVPLEICILLMAVYIFAGALMFSLWETEWSYLISSYFCFITLSTIGFGDYVFGMGTNEDNTSKLILCSIYLLLGLAVIAMCFNLMQDEVKYRFHVLGVWLGLSEDLPSERGTVKFSQALLEGHKSLGAATPQPL